MNRAAGLLVALLVSAGPAVRAQEVHERAPPAAPLLSITLSHDSADALRPPVVRAERLLQDGVFDGALRNGFSVRLHFRLELWRKAALFDHLQQPDAEWDAVVRLDPLSGEFDLIRTGGDVEHYRTMDAVSRALAKAFSVELLPPAGADTRYYYVSTLDIASLSQSELDEVERWLRGDVGPAISSRGGLSSALAVGARRLLIRLSGLPHLRLEARTATFLAGR